MRLVGCGVELAEAGEVEGDRDVLAVGGDDFDGGVVGGDIVGVKDEPGEPASGVHPPVGGAVAVGGVGGGGVGEEAEIFRDEGIVV